MKLVIEEFLSSLPFSFTSYPAILDSKWLNASFQKSKYEEEIITAITSAAADLEEIHALKSPFVDTLIELYCQTRSLDRVKEKQLELEDAANKANLTTNITTPAIENSYLPHLEISNKASRNRGSIAACSLEDPSP